MIKSNVFFTNHYKVKLVSITYPSGDFDWTPHIDPRDRLVAWWRREGSLVSEVTPVIGQHVTGSDALGDFYPLPIL